MYLILFAQTLLGIWSVIRTLQLFRARALLKSSAVTKTGILFISLLLLSTSFCASSSILRFILVIFAILSNFLVLFLCERRQIDTLKSEIPIFLDRWILNLKLGHSATQARELALRLHTQKFCLLILPVFAVEQSFQNRKHILLSRSVCDEFRKINRESHLALSRLETMRENVRRADNFRRKSGQAVRQSRIQSFVMVILLIALIGFTVFRYGPYKVADLITASVTLTICGGLTMHYLARGIKWKL